MFIKEVNFILLVLININSAQLLNSLKHRRYTVDNSAYRIENTICKPRNEPLSDGYVKDVKMSVYIDNRIAVVGFNFTWLVQLPDTKVPPDYKIVITSNVGPPLTKYFCLITMRNYNDGYLSYAGYDTVKAGADYNVTISTVSGNASVNFNASMPDCTMPHLANSVACIELNVAVSCENRTMNVFYVVPDKLGGTITMRLCKLIELGECYCKSCPIKDDLPLAGEHTLVIPETESFNESFYVSLWGPRWEYRRRFSVREHLSSCIEHELSDLSRPSIIIPVVFGCVALAFITTLVILAYKYRKSIKATFALVSCCSAKSFSGHHTKLLLAFVDDSPRHKDMVLKLANLLEISLDFKVLFEQFEKEKVYADPVSWMENALTEAKVVVFVWSPGALQRWQQSDKLISEHDIFTPLLKRAEKCSHLNEEDKKFCSVYFEYCSKNDIPEVFQEQPFRVFKLMKDFKSYCSYIKCSNDSAAKTTLLKTEKEFSRKCDKHGSVLDVSNKEMLVFVKDNPKWYLDSATSKESLA